MKKQALALFLGGALLTQPLMPLLSVHAESHTSTTKEKKESVYQLKMKEKREDLMSLDKEMLSLKSEIKDLNEGLKKEKELDKKEIELKETEDILTKRWEEFSKRLSAWQLKGTPEDNFIEILFGSKGLGDLISRTMTFKTLVQADNEQITNLKEETERMLVEKNALKKELDQLHEKKVEALKKEKLLNNKKKEMAKELDKLKEKELKRIQDEMEKQEELKKKLLEKQLVDDTFNELRSLTNQLSEVTGVSFAYPTNGRLTSPFSTRKNPMGSGYENHTGMDIANSIGTSVLATADGVVEKSLSTSGGYGTHIVLKHSINGKTFYSLYGHLSLSGVEVGEKVKQGEAIGLMGSTGRSTGPHLHFEIRDKNYVPMNPRPFLDKGVEEKEKQEKKASELKEKKEQAKKKLKELK